ncbi:MAG: YlbF family regulator [Comamonadaceae bacterium]|nr:YlbF family regulator [Comamonadaceae bacterium]
MTGDAKVVQAAQLLGKLLAETPEYQTFLQALEDINHNLEVQKLSAKSASTTTPSNGDAVTCWNIRAR